MNRKVILYIAMSIDGYLADENGGVAWLGGQGEENETDNGYAEFIKGIDTVIMGRITYEQIVRELSPDEWPYRGLDCYVASEGPAEDSEHAAFLSGDIGNFVRTIRGQGGKDIWIAGGATLLRYFMEEQLIDEYWISIVPVLLGKGIRLFLPGDFRQELKLERTERYDGIVTNVYTRRNQGD